MMEHVHHAMREEQLPFHAHVAVAILGPGALPFPTLDFFVFGDGDFPKHPLHHRQVDGVDVRGILLLIHDAAKVRPSTPSTRSVASSTVQAWPFRTV